MRGGPSAPARSPASAARRRSSCPAFWVRRSRGAGSRSARPPYILRLGPRLSADEGADLQVLKDGHVREDLPALRGLGDAAFSTILCAGRPLSLPLHRTSACAGARGRRSFSAACSSPPRSTRSGRRSPPCPPSARSPSGRGCCRNRYGRYSVPAVPSSLQSCVLRPESRGMAASLRPSRASAQVSGLGTQNSLCRRSAP